MIAASEPFPSRGKGWDGVNARLSTERFETRFPATLSPCLVAAILPPPHPRPFPLEGKGEGFE